LAAPDAIQLSPGQAPLLQNLRERKPALVFRTDVANILRIAVESFKFPTDSSEVISQDEAKYRTLHIDREYAKVERELRAQGITGEALENMLKDAKAELLADSELGLQGRFVKTQSESSSHALVKPVADSVITVGSTQGLSANLQDVRYDNNLLYAFWVPANNIDPLDVFDIGNRLVSTSWADSFVFTLR